MKSNKRLSTSGFLLISLLVLPSLCSATMTASINTDKENYFIGNQVTFTGSIVLVDELGCCNLFTENNVSLTITDGDSTACSLEVEEGYYSFGGNCSLDMNVTEMYPGECTSYGGNNTITYEWIYWEIPSDWDTGSYTATLTATACGTSGSDTASFRVLSNALSSNNEVDVTRQTTAETSLGYAQADITLENSNVSAQSSIVTVPIPGASTTVNLALTVLGSGTRHIAALENSLICSPQNATINSIDYSSSSEALTFHLSGGGLQEIVVYVESKGEPESITQDGSPITTWTYDSTAKTVTFTATITCPDEIIVSWYVAPTTTTTIAVIRGGGGGGGGGGAASIGKVKPSCFDGIENCHDGLCETDVDCGGSCGPCMSCSDGIQNQGEAGVDCGGPCPPCKVTTTVKSAATTTTVTETTLATATTTITPITTTVVQVTLSPSTTVAAPAPGIPLGVTEGVIILTAIVLISLAFMIQTGRI